MASKSPAGPRWTVGALLALTAVTGLVDAVSFLRLGHVFAANMTGNVVFLGFSVVPGSGIEPISSVVAIGGFVLGAIAGGQVGARLDARPTLWPAWAFGAQAGLLAVVAALCGLGALHPDGAGRLAILGLLALAFGLQNSTVRRLNEPDLTTTVLTQTITGLSADGTAFGGPGAKPRRRLGSVLTMLLGAAAGTLLLQVTFAGVIAVAAVVVTTVGVVFRLQPGNARATSEVDPR